MVLINQQSHVAYEFPCGKWLAKNEDDGKIVRELALAQQWALDENGQIQMQAAEHRAIITYAVSVVTGTIRGAGTDVRLVMSCIGDNAIILTHFF